MVQANQLMRSKKMKNKKQNVCSSLNQLLEVGNKVRVAHDIKYPTVTIGQGVVGYVKGFTEDNRPEVKSDVGNFICEGKDLVKIVPSKLEKDLITLLKNIKYITGYMSESWGDKEMLSRMAKEDGISPWCIDQRIYTFATKHNLDLTDKKKA